MSVEGQIVHLKLIEEASRPAVQARLLHRALASLCTDATGQPVLQGLSTFVNLVVNGADSSSILCEETRSTFADIVTIMNLWKKETNLNHLQSASSGLATRKHA